MSYRLLLGWLNLNRAGGGAESGETIRSEKADVKRLEREGLERLGEKGGVEV